MTFSQLKKEKEDKDEKYKTSKDKKYIIQNFFKQYPNFERAWLTISKKRKAPPEEQEIKEIIEKFQKLTIILSENDENKENMKKYYPISSNIISFYWKEGIEINIEKIAESIKNFHMNIDEKSIFQEIDWKQMSEMGSILLTVTTAIMELKMKIEEYSFRKPKEEVMDNLTKTIIKECFLAVDTLIGKEGTKEDKRNLFQSILREFSSTMNTIYETTMIDTIEEIIEKKEQEKLEWFQKNDPINEIKNLFEMTTQSMVIACLSAKESISTQYEIALKR